MGFLRKAAVKQTTQTLGYANLVLLPNAGDTRAFQDALGVGPVKCRYMMRGIGFFVHLRGVFTAPDQLTRDEVISSSNGGADVSIPSGTTDVYLLDYEQFVVDPFTATKTLTNKDASNSWVFTHSVAADLNLPALATALPDFWGFLKNGGTADLTLKGNGADTIDESGTTSVIFTPGQSAFVFNDTAAGKWRISRMGGAAKTPTVQKLLSGSGATYTPSAGAKWIRVTIKGGGAGGNASGGSPNNGSAGGTTSFNGVTALGGGAPVFYGPGNGGSGGADNSLVVMRTPGATGHPHAPWYQSSTNAAVMGGAGGGHGGGRGGYPSVGVVATAGVANSGGGGGGGGYSSSTFATLGDFQGAGGGEGETAVVWLPATTYTYTVGAGGAGGAAGVQAGAAGGSGVIFVEEHY